jgi:hypothetical protein
MVHGDDATSEVVSPALATEADFIQLVFTAPEPSNRRFQLDHRDGGPAVGRFPIAARPRE